MLRAGIQVLMPCDRYRAPLSQRLAEADARMIAQQLRIDARLSNCIVDEVVFSAVPTPRHVQENLAHRIVWTLA